MSSGGGSSTSTSKVELPAWVDKASKDNFGMAVDIANKPFVQYDGQRVTGITPAFSDLSNKLQAGYGSTTSAINSASAMFDKAGNKNANTAEGLFNTIGNKNANIAEELFNKAGNKNANIAEGLFNKAGNKNINNEIVENNKAYTNYNNYKNPFENDVIRKSLSDMDRSRQLALQSNSDKAISSGAFGGSRSAIIDAVTNSESIRDQGLMASQLRNQGFNNAMELSAGDAGRATQAGMANQDADLRAKMAEADNLFKAGAGSLDAQKFEADNLFRAGAGSLDAQKYESDNLVRAAAGSLDAQKYESDNLFRAGAGNLDAQKYESDNLARAGAGSLDAQKFEADNLIRAGAGKLDAAQTSQTSKTQDNNAIMQYAGVDQKLRQDVLDSQMKAFDEKRNAPIDDLNLRLSALGMSPYGKTETNSSQQSTSPDYGTMGLGLMSLLMGFSDDNVKTDKEKVGKIPNTNLDLWAFRYKKDPKTYPKTVGLMASQVEKEMPEAVKTVGKRRVLDYGMITKKVQNVNSR